MPSTAYAKATLDLPRSLRGIEYVVSHVLAFLTPIVLLPGTALALRKKRRALGLPVAALAWGFPAYAIVTTGDGKALRSYIAQRQFPDENPSHVTGAIGAKGYYSDAFIYDRYGLVTPRVAHRTTAREEPVSKPGHDKEVPIDYFLEDAPTILWAGVVQHDDARGIKRRWRGTARWCRDGLSDPRLSTRYVPDLARVDEAGSGMPPTYIVVWKHVGDGRGTEPAWTAFEQRVGSLIQGKHLPQPPASSPGYHR